MADKTINMGKSLNQVEFDAPKVPLPDAVKQVAAVGKGAGSSATITHAEDMSKAERDKNKGW